MPAKEIIAFLALVVVLVGIPRYAAQKNGDQSKKNTNPPPLLDPCQPYDCEAQITNHMQIPDPTNCNMYYECTGNKRHHRTCKDKYKFDNVTRSCVRDYDANCHDSCPESSIEAGAGRQTTPYDGRVVFVRDTTTLPNRPSLPDIFVKTVTPRASRQPATTATEASSPRPTPPFQHTPAIQPTIAWPGIGIRTTPSPNVPSCADACVFQCIKGSGYVLYADPSDCGKYNECNGSRLFAGRVCAPGTRFDARTCTCMTANKALCQRPCAATSKTSLGPSSSSSQAAAESTTMPPAADTTVRTVDTGGIQATDSSVVKPSSSKTQKTTRASIGGGDLTTAAISTRVYHTTATDSGAATTNAGRPRPSTTEDQHPGESAVTSPDGRGNARTTTAAAAAVDGGVGSTAGADIGVTARGNQGLSGVTSQQPDPCVDGRPQVPCTADDDPLADPKSCKHYYVCQRTGKTFHWKKRPCPGQQLFNQKTLACDATLTDCQPICPEPTVTTDDGQFTTVVPTLDPCNRLDTCSPGARLASPKNCRQFFQCSNSSSWERLSCPGAFYDTVTRLCSLSQENCQPNCPGQGGTSSPPGGQPELELITTETYEDKELVFRCSTSAAAAGTQFEWALNGNGIVLGAAGSRFHTHVLHDMSILSIDPAKPRDTGTVTCVVRIPGKLPQSQSLPFKVLAKPLVTVQPMTSLLEVDQGDSKSLVLTCSASVPQTGHQDEDKDVMFHWFKNGQPIDNGQIYTVVKLRGKRSQMAAVVSEPAEFACAATNDAGSSEHAVSSVTVVAPDDPFCEAEMKAGVSWTRTIPGMVNQQPCPSGTIGVAKRACMSPGNTTIHWDEPNMNDCVSPEFQKVEEQLASILEGVGASNSTMVAEVAEALQEVTRSKDPLPPGDLNSAINSVEMLTKVRAQQANNLTMMREELESVMQAVSNLLDQMNTESWKSVQKNDPYRAVTVMRAVDTYARTFTSQLRPGQKVDVAARNLLLQLASVPKNTSEDLVYPERTHANVEMDWVTSDSIVFDQETLQQVAEDIPGKVFLVASSYYRTLDELLPVKMKDGALNSRVLSLSIDGLMPGKDLSPPVRMTFSKPEKYADNYTTNCAFWDFGILGRGAWQTFGCRSVVSNSSSVSCECDHLTNFAILMTTTPAPPEHHYILTIISLVGCIISIVSLTLTLIMYCSMWKHVKSHHAAVLMNLCVALLIANLLFVIGADKTKPRLMCIVVTALLQYFWLAAFFLMLANGIELMLYIIYVFHHRRRKETALLIICGWLLPATIVAICLAVTRTEGYGNDQFCWLSTHGGLIWSFIGPALAIIAVNLVILVVVMRRVATAKVPSEKRKSKVRAAFWNFAVISPMIGVTWLFGVFAVNDELVVFQYIFAILNSLQGLFIFIFHALCNKRESTSRQPSTKSTKSSKRSDKS